MLDKAGYVYVNMYTIGKLIVELVLELLVRIFPM